jgi:hypothetical protein
VISSDECRTEGMGMVFGTGRRDARENDDPVDQRRVPYRLASYEHDQEGKRFKSSNVAFSFWSASKYVLILSLMLWWLPMFGQMIAGYVGGRRAGGPWKGVLASIVPVVCLYAVMTGFDSGFLPSHMLGVAIAPAAVGSVLTHNVPFISPYLQFSSDYVGSFVAALAGASPYGINTYVLTVAFAYVGGVLAEQNRREIEFTSGAVMSNTTVLVHEPNAFAQRMAEAQGQPRGTLAGIGALLHLPRHRDASVSGGFVSRGRGDWSNAVEASYYDEGEEMDDPYLLPAAAPMCEPRSQGYMRQKSKTGSHHHHSHHKDPWQNKQKRRGAPNYSAKPRFSYPQHEQEPRRETRGYNGSMVRRSKDAPRYSMTSDPRSIRRAEKMIDREWGSHRKFSSFRDEGEREEPARRAPEETEAVAASRRKEHHNNHQWDSI